jgi:GDPmannose 4,6-dehydratase
LIFGISGQDGAYLAELLLDKGYAVFGTARDCEQANFDKLQYLNIRDRVTLHSCSLTDFRSVAEAINHASPDEVYNLAGQSSVGLSFDQPVETIDGFVNGTINILEAFRLLGSKARFYNASSSECFGDTGDRAANEKAPFQPCSPYAVGKAAAHWLVANYRDAYGLFACSGILFNHESPLRPVRFVTQKIVRGAVDISEGKPEKLILGDLNIRRDWGWAPEYVDAMWRMLQTDIPTDFVIATGRAHSLEDYVERVFSTVGLEWRAHVTVDPGLFRPLEIRSSVGDSSKALSRLGWAVSTDLQTIIKKMVEAEIGRRRHCSGEDLN